MIAPIYLQLCRSNSIGSRFVAPTIIEEWERTAEEAAVELRKNRPNGYFVQITPADPLSREDQERYLQNMQRVSSVLAGNGDGL